MLISGDSHPDRRLKGLDLGADDFLPKPLSPEELVMRVEKALNRYEQLNPVPRAWSGDLTQFSLPTVLNMMEMASTSGLLKVEGEGTGIVEFEAGKPLNATLEGQPSLDAVDSPVRMFEWTQGAFWVVNQEPLGTDELDLPLSKLMIKVVQRQIDLEQKVQAADLPAQVIETAQEPVAGPNLDNWQLETSTPWELSLTPVMRPMKREPTTEMARLHGTPYSSPERNNGLAHTDGTNTWKYRGSYYSFEAHTHNTGQSTKV